MGESALKSHKRSLKHSGSMKNAASSSITSYVTPRESGKSVRVVQTQSSDLNAACKAHDLATEAEILRAPKVVRCRYSYSSSAHTSDLFRRMFPDSEVAKAFTCEEKRVRTWDVMVLDHSSDHLFIGR